MGTMIDKPSEYKGEAKAWECFANNLPSEAVVYNNREINGREFDFCILMKNVGLIIVEVKGWTAESIIDVAGVDEIVVRGYSKPQRSPKKQARAYRFAMLNMVNDRYNVSPLIFDMVCYPFISRKEYLEKRLDIVSEESLTIFKEDLSDPLQLGDKILAAYNQCRNIPHAEMDDVLMAKIRQHFEPHFVIRQDRGLEEQIPYSMAYVIPGRLRKKEICGIVERYLAGTKTVIFVDSCDTAESILYVLEDELNEKGIEAVQKDLKYNPDAGNDLTVNGASFRIFNFELYIVDQLSDMADDDITIFEGKCSKEEHELLERLSKKSLFNSQQFFIEHADVKKNILVRAGAGTGKTYSMVSRVSYLCNRYENPIMNIVDDIAMVTFTNDAADNMKKRLKRLFVNYFILTGNPKYLKLIEDTDLMRISTIHMFAREIIRESSMQMGLGDNFSVTSGDYAKEQIYEKRLNDFIAKKESDNPNFINEIKVPLYEFTKNLVEFSNQLYNKSVDIKKITPDQFGKPPEEMPFFNEIITDVIIASEIEYANKVQESNKTDLREMMIVLNDVVSNSDKKKTHLAYKYIFIDEFQDTDDAQIDSFLKIQKIIGEECRLFVVGDLKQCIYRFRGASTSAFRRLHATPDRWEEHSINTNYRTDSGLLEIMDTVFQGMGKQGRLPYEHGKDSLVSNLSCGARKDALFRCVPYHGKNEQMETLLGVMKQERSNIMQLGQKRDLSTEEKTIAILVRENWQIDSIITECKELDESIEIETKVGGDLYQLDSSMDFYKLLLALTNPDDPVCLVNFMESNYVRGKILYQGLQNCDRKTQVRKLTTVLDSYLSERLGKTWTELLAYVHANPVLAVIKLIYDGLKPWENYSDDSDRQQFYKTNFDLLIEKIVDAFSVDYLTLTVITKSMQVNILTRQKEQARETKEDAHGVRFLCTTVHKAKGLEYGTVILPYTDQRIGTVRNNKTDVNYADSKLAYSIKVSKNRNGCNSNYDFNEEADERINEEARILYVALTRSIRSCIWMKDTSQNPDIAWSSFLEV